MNKKLMRTLSVFVKTVESASMSNAAKQLYMTTSAVSQHIQKLEQEVGLALFNRNTRTLTLTEAGEIYYKSSVKLLATANQTEQRLQQLQQTPSGELKVIAPVGFGGGLLSQPLKYLIDEFSQIQMQITLTDEPVDIIASGADIALCIGPLQDSSLVARHLADWNMVLCCSSDSPLTKSSVDMQALSEQPRISHISETRQLLTSNNKSQAQLPAPRLTLNNLNGMIQLTLDNVGYALLPEPEVRHHLQAGRLCQLSPACGWQAPMFSVYAVTPQRHSVPAKTKAAIASLKKWFDKVGQAQAVNH